MAGFMGAVWYRPHDPVEVMPALPAWPAGPEVKAQSRCGRWGLRKAERQEPALCLLTRRSISSLSKLLELAHERGPSVGVGGRWSADPGVSAKDGKADRRQFTLLARSAPSHQGGWSGRLAEVSRGQGENRHSGDRTDRTHMWALICVHKGFWSSGQERDLWAGLGWKRRKWKRMGRGKMQRRMWRRRMRRKMQTPG